ncbi:MAG TPA: DUF1844 domain-containing protein, partial [Armatimonadota bacterium]
MSDETRNDELKENIQAESAAPEQPAETEEPGRGIEGIPDVDVYTLLRSFSSLLSMHVWHWMGLMKNPVTGKMDKDLAQAKVAIDTLAAMAGQLEGKIPEADQRELNGL